jgi:rhodanese-related sulfurtransferase
VVQIEPEGIDHVRGGDRTAVVFDVRSTEEFRAGTLEGAACLPREEVARAKDDGTAPAPMTPVTPPTAGSPRPDHTG